ncbi:MAG: hypothetical protein ACTSU0_09115, partial [Alphaproteobacteria bacterium]
MIAAIPLTLIPLIAFNLIGFFSGGDPFAGQVFSVTMVSGEPWIMTLADVLIVIAIIVLFVEVVRAARPSPNT